MSKGLDVTASVMQLRVPDIQDGTGWYTQLMGRPPDMQPVEGVAEWELLSGAWFQIIEARPDPGRNRVRFGVKDLVAETDRLRESPGLELADPVIIEGVIMYADGEDPYGNRIGLFQVLPEVPAEE